MNPKVDKAIRGFSGGCLLVFCFAYVFFGQEWARLPFVISLVVVSLYNMFFTRARKQ